MIKIIKEGKIQKRYQKITDQNPATNTIECVMCGCEFEYSHDEIKYSPFLEGDSLSSYVICPCCGDYVSDW